MIISRYISYMPKKLTFVTAREKIINKFSHLDLLKFKSRNELATFLDKDYGEFEALFSSIIECKTNHPERSKYNKDCGRRSNNSKINRKKTVLEKYGVENISQSKIIKDKIKKTVLEKYGKDHISKLSFIKEKKRQTSLKKYGVNHPQQNKFVREKTKRTNLKKYGVECPSQSNVIKDKTKQYFINTYGVSNPSYVTQFQEKRTQTFIKKYDEVSPLKNNDIKNKLKKTYLKKYGAENPFQLKEVKEKIKLTKIKTGSYYDVINNSLMYYYNNSCINKYVSYTTLRKYFLLFGDPALSVDFYINKTQSSKIANLWLDFIENDLGYDLIRSPEFIIKPFNYKADGFDPKTNTVYEFYGDYWHGRPFKNTGINKHIDNSFNTLFYKTIDRENNILDLGYSIVYIWESDFIESIKLHN